MNEGHNSELTELERKALFFNHYHHIAAQLENLQAAQAKYKKLRKLAKADGVKLADMDFAIKCAEIEDSTIITSDLARQIEIAKWFSLPMDYEPDMFGTPVGVERAEAEGTTAGLKGETMKSPYTEKDEAAAWEKGWHAGQTVLAEGIKSAKEKRQTPDLDESDFDPDFEEDEPRPAA